MTRPVPQLCIDFIKRAEACRLLSYRDSAGVWTIGYGHTFSIHEGMTIDSGLADSFLSMDLGAAARRLEAVTSAAALAALSDHQYAALVSFVFNLGAQPGWTIWKLINAGNLDGVPAEMARFDKARVNGELVVVPGLDHRRMAEIALWRESDAVTAANIVLASPAKPPPSSTTRAADTPPTPAEVKPLHRSKAFVTSAISAGTAAIAAGGPMIKQASDAIAPFAGSSPFVGKMVEDLAMGSAALALLTLFFVWLHHHQAATA